MIGYIYSASMVFCRASVHLLIVKRIIVIRNDDTMSFKRLLYGLHDAPPGSRTENSIGLWQLIQELLLITLSQAASYDQAAAAPGLFVLRHIENRRNGFFLG